MSILNNYISKLLITDKNSAYSVLTYIDIDKELSISYIIDYIDELIKRNPILKQTIVEENNQLYIRNIEPFDLNKCLKIKYTNKNFNHYISTILNEPFSEYKFYIFICINKKLQKSRLYFKIHHAYADGYKIINMLTSHVYKHEENNQLPKFKRSTSILNTIYHYIIGTILLILINIITPFKMLFFCKQQQNINTITDYIICKPFHIDKIKNVTSKHKITINDFLYALMIKTDSIYTQQNRVIHTISPINISNLTETNNMCPIFNSIYNSSTTSTLLNQVHTTFNHYKYSLFIPLLSILINKFTCYINFDIIKSCYTSIIDSVDYVYSNIIGPPLDQLTINISNIHFLTTAKNNEIIYNIISSGNDINIICSFKDGVVDKKRLKNSIYKAYNNLMN